MKKILFIPLVLISLLELSYGQTIDLAELEGGTYSENKLPYGSKTRLKLENVNTFRYQVEVSHQLINIITDPPQAIQNLFGISVEAAETNNEKAAQAAKEVDKTLGAMSTVKGSIKSNPSLAIEMDALISHCEKYKESLSEIARLKKWRVDLLRIMMDKDINTHAQLNTAVNALLLKAELNSLEELENLVQPEPIESTLTKLVYTYYDVEESYEVAKSLFHQEIEKENLQLVIKNLAKVEMATHTIEEAHEKVEDESLEKVAKDIRDIIEAIQDPDRFVVSGTDIKVKGDHLKYEIKINQRDENPLLPPKGTKTYNLDFPVKGGWRVDFSTGPILSFGPGAIDSVYYDAPVMENGVILDSTVLKPIDNLNKVRLDLAAFAHYSYRTASGPSIGFSIGIGADFESFQKVNLNLGAGVSLVCGRERKIFLTAGGSLYSVDRLKDPSLIMTPVKAEGATYNALQFAPFIALSYAITRSK